MIYEALIVTPASNDPITSSSIDGKQPIRTPASPERIFAGGTNRNILARSAPDEIVAAVTVSEIVPASSA